MRIPTANRIGQERSVVPPSKSLHSGHWAPPVLEECSCSLFVFQILLLLYRIDTVWIESDVILDRDDGCIRCLVGPRRIHRSVAAERNAVVRAVALVGAIGVMVRSFQQRHVDILLRDVMDRSVTSLSQRSVHFGCPR